jgi:hypothetical protein
MRPIYEIAAEIRKDWRNPWFGAVPYIRAMADIANPGDTYIAENGYSIIRGFLANAKTWKGDTARTIKTELKSMLNRR